MTEKLLPKVRHSGESRNLEVDEGWIPASAGTARKSWTRPPFLPWVGPKERNLLL
jgi:hypothetical protein